MATNTNLWNPEFSLIIHHETNTDLIDIGEMAFDELRPTNETISFQMIFQETSLPEGVSPPDYLNVNLSMGQIQGDVNPFKLKESLNSPELSNLSIRVEIGEYGIYGYGNFDIKCYPLLVDSEPTIVQLSFLGSSDDPEWDASSLQFVLDLRVFSSDYPYLITSNQEDRNHVPEGGVLPFFVRTNIPILPDGQDYYIIVEKYSWSGGEEGGFDDWYEISGGDIQQEIIDGEEVKYLKFNSNNYNIDQTFNIASVKDIPIGRDYESGRLLIRSYDSSDISELIKIKHMQEPGRYEPYAISFTDNDLNKISSVLISENSTETIKLLIESNYNQYEYPYSIDISSAQISSVGDGTLFTVTPESTTVVPNGAQHTINLTVTCGYDPDQHFNDMARYRYWSDDLIAHLDLTQIDAGEVQLIVTPSNDIEITEGGTSQISFRFTASLVESGSVFIIINKYDGEGHDNSFYTLSGGDLQTDSSQGIDYLEFTSTNYGTDQSFNIVSISDDDSVEEVGKFRAYVAGSDPDEPNTNFDFITQVITVTQPEVTTSTQEIITSTSSLSISEKSSASFTVKLAADPNGNFTVSLTKLNEVNANFEITKDGEEITGLIFTTDNWDSNQIVTVYANSDSDTESGSADLVLSSIGVDSKTITLTEVDDQLGIGLVGSAASITVFEGQTANFGVKLNKDPGSDFIVSGLILSESNASFSLSPTNYSFDSNDWDVFQYYTITSNADENVVSGTGVLQLTGEGDVGALSVPITEVDDELLIRVVVSREEISIPEGSSDTFTVKLSHGITEGKSIVISKRSGGSDNINVSPTNLTFTTSDWDIEQTVTVTVTEDENAENGSATFPVSSTDINIVSASVLVNEVENDFHPDEVLDGGKGDITSFVNFFDLILESSINDRNNLQEDVDFKQKYVYVGETDFGLIFQSEAANFVSLTPYIKPFFFVRVRDSGGSIQDYVDSGKMTVDEMSDSNLKFEHTILEFPTYTVFFQRFSGVYYLTFPDEIVPAKYTTITDNILDGSRLLVQTSNGVQTMKIIGSDTSKIVLKGRHAQTILNAKAFSIFFFEPETLFMKGLEKNVTEKKVLSKSELREEDGYLMYNDVQFNTLGIIENIECFFIDSETKLNISRNIQVSSLL